MKRDAWCALKPVSGGALAVEDDTAAVATRRPGTRTTATSTCRRRRTTRLCPRSDWSRSATASSTCRGVGSRLASAWLITLWGLFGWSLEPITKEPESLMSTADVTSAGPAPEHVERTPAITISSPIRKTAMWVFLGSECIFFGSMIATFLLYRNTTDGGPGARDLRHPVHLGQLVRAADEFADDGARPTTRSSARTCARPGSGSARRRCSAPPSSPVRSSSSPSSSTRV